MGINPRIFLVVKKGAKRANHPPSATPANLTISFQKKITKKTSESDDSEAELQLEMQRIQKERQAAAQRKAQADAERKKKEEEEEALRGNPLMNMTGDDTEQTMKRRWDDDVLFKNQAADEPPTKRRYINDTVRNDFHRKFMERYFK